MPTLKSNPVPKASGRLRRNKRALLPSVAALVPRSIHQDIPAPATNDIGDALSMYMRAVGEVPLLKVEEEKKLAARIRRGTVPTLKSAGLILESEAAWKIAGGVFLPVVTFLMLAVLTGPFLILIDIRKSLRALETTSNRSSSSALPADYREPHL